jgi:hypothetical protein
MVVKTAYGSRQELDIGFSGNFDLQGVLENGELTKTNIGPNVTSSEFALARNTILG